MWATCHKLADRLVEGVNDAVDSDAAQLGTCTVPVTLAPGEQNTSVDAGVWFPLTLGNLAFRDVNNNGVVDAGDTGVPAVTAELLDAAGTVVSTTTTDTQGAFTFTGLTPGDYTVRVPAAEFAPTGDLAGLARSTGGASEPAPDPAVLATTTTGAVGHYLFDNPQPGDLPGPGSADQLRLWRRATRVRHLDRCQRIAGGFGRAGSRPQQRHRQRRQRDPDPPVSFGRERLSHTTRSSMDLGAAGILNRLAQTSGTAGRPENQTGPRARRRGVR